MFIMISVFQGIMMVYVFAFMKKKTIIYKFFNNKFIFFVFFLKKFRE